MGVNILFGGSSASKDKCFFPLPFLLSKTALWAQHLGWEHWAHFSSTGRGHTPQAGGQPRGLGAGCQRSGQLSHTPCFVLRGWKSALLMLDHAASQPSMPDSQRSAYIAVMLSYGQPFFSDYFFHLNGDCDNNNGSQATFWCTDDRIFKGCWGEET